MHNFFKFNWFLRNVVYCLFYKNKNLFCYIGKPIFLRNFSNFIFSKHVRVFPNSRFECERNATVIFGANITIGQNCHITCGEKITIGDHTVICPNVVISDIRHHYEDHIVPIIKQGFSTKPILIGNNVFIGSNVIILPGAVISDNAIIGAGTIVSGIVKKGEKRFYRVYKGK